MSTATNDYDILTAQEYNDKYALGQPHNVPALIRCCDTMVCVATGIKREYYHLNGDNETYFFMPSVNVFVPHDNQFGTCKEIFSKLIKRC